MEKVRMASLRGARRFTSGYGRVLQFAGAAGLLVALLLSAPTGARAQAPATSGSPQAAAPPARTTALLDLQSAFNAIADELEPAVVTVLSSKSVHNEGADNGNDLRDSPFRDSPFGHTRPHRSTGTGSGVIISKDGWVLTNDHVVGGADRIIVRLHDGREFSGIARRDPRSDLALIKIDSPTPLPMAKLGDSDTVKIGNWAIAIGSPYRYEGSFSVGVISSLFRSQEIQDPGASEQTRFYPNMLQTDAAINPGNSGGPLCNINGEVIGVNTAIESEGGGSVGIGFAIPINTAKFAIAQLMEKGYVSYGFLGVWPISVTPREAAAMNVSAGALLHAEPSPNSPAGKSGLHAGDVVTAINKRPIHNAIELRTVVAQTPPQTTIDITFVRDGKEQTVKATLTDPPEAKEAAPPADKPKAPVKAHLGIEVQTLTEKLAENAKISAKTPGVVVKSIDPNASVADIDGFTEGLVILKVNNIATPTVQAFQSAVSQLKSGDLVRVLYQDHDEIRFAVIPVD